MDLELHGNEPAPALKRGKTRGGRGKMERQDPGRLGLSLCL